MGYFTSKFAKSGKDWMSEYETKWGSSSFWLGDDNKWSSHSAVTGTRASTTESIKRAAAKRSIANFVAIVTKKQIPVDFVEEGSTSATDGNRVLISASVNDPKDFDTAVGLALHEGSHIKLSDYAILRNLGSKVSRNLGKDLGKYQDKATNVGIDLLSLCKDMLNWVEDRRIDQYIYDEAPGYQGYYHSMYKKYFNSEFIETAMKSASFRDETVESYTVRVINLHSEFSDLSALKGLQSIWDVVDLETISRLQNTDAAFDVAMKIVRIILDNVHSKRSQRNNNENQKPENGKPEKQKGDGQQKSQSEKSESSESDTKDNKESDSTEEPKDTEEDSTGSGSDKESKEDSKEEPGEDSTGSGSDEDTEEEPGEESNDTGSGEEPKDISKKEFEEALNSMAKQIQFLSGNVEKDTLTSEEISQLKNIIESKTDLTVVGDEFGNGEIQCVVARNMTTELLNDPSFPIKAGWSTTAKYEAEVEKGIQLGTVLGKKLLLRSESRETVYNRQTTGKIDKRMISALGYGYDTVFYTKETDKYKKANLHISIDASGSMAGDKWRKSMVTTVAIAKAVDMIPNLEIQISFRTTNDSNLPYIVIAYDSRVDKFTKIRSMFPKLGPSNTTPEGLCFEGIQKLLVPSGAETDSYFLNISDGEPYYSCKGKNYSGSYAAAHTNRQVKRMQESGIQILSYFVSEGHDYRAEAIFRECYGKAAAFIDVNSVQEITKTMNKLFLKKD